MYKKQLTWQKILCFAALVACGILFLYSLGLSTDLFDGLFYALPEEAKLATAKVNVPGAEVYYQIQPFNRQLLNNSILLLLVGCLLFMTNTHSRRRYYISNAVSTFGFASASAAAKRSMSPLSVKSRASTRAGVVISPASAASRSARRAISQISS